jgi:hypothetical protein
MRVRAFAAAVAAFAVFGAFGVLSADAANPGGFSPVVNTLDQFTAPGVLYGTSCPASGQCVAVGFDIGYQPLVLSGDPSTWGIAQMQQMTLGQEGRDVARLFSVTCTSSTSCVAVGREDADLLVLTGDPATWGPAQTQRIALGSAFGSAGELNAVTCTSSTACVAVGDDFNGQPIVLAGNPASWGAGQVQEITLDNALFGGGYLGSVACASASSCVAVGADYNFMPIVLAGDPATWGTDQAQEITLDSSFGDGGELNAVTCTSASACVAVGDDGNGKPITLAGDPSSWGTAQTNEIGLYSGFGGGGVLVSVACTSASSCVATGIDGNQKPLVVTGDPATPWTPAQAQEIVLGASFGLFGELASVACTSASECVATGIDGNNEPLTLSGDPSTWDASNAEEITLNGTQFGVSAFPASLNCVSNTSCISLGSYNGGGTGAYFMQGDPASWDSASPLQFTHLNDFSFLNASSCPSPTFCVAVGFDEYNGAAMVVTGDPSTFNLEPSAVIGGDAFADGAYFTAISCPSTSFCVAVGQDFNAQPFVLAGDPATWASGGGQEIVVPPQFHSTGILQSVDCTSDTFCVAVGYDGDHKQPLVLSGDPSTWNESNLKQITMNNWLGYFGEFTSVACTSHRFCVAVGDSGGAAFKPLVLRGNPATWGTRQAFLLRVPSQSSSTAGGFGYGGGSGSGYLTSVSCDANTAKFCVVVGGDKHGAPLYLTGNPNDWKNPLLPWKGRVLWRPQKNGPSFLTAELLTTSCTANKCFAGGDSNGGLFVGSFNGG